MINPAAWARSEAAATHEINRRKLSANTNKLIAFF